MLKRCALRLYGAVLLGALFGASPAFAQFTPRPLNEPSVGEKYHIEGSTGFWSPSADMTISSESLGIVGSAIDFKNDLGLTDQRFGELHAVLRPTEKQKLRFEYIPIKYTQSATLTRSIVFNGQLYRFGVPTNSTLDWKAFRFAYEYDAFYRSRGFAGLIIEAKYTDVKASLTTTPPIISEFAHASAPIPAIGGIGRFYIVPSVSITGEYTAFKIPESISQDYKAHYNDFDLYGTVNFTNNLGAKLGYRSLDLGYLVKRDTGSFTLRGIYFGVVARY